MAIRHYYIGVGGTGARVAEALVHLCAAGLGPDELFLMIVDPDAGNGNLSRTTDLINRYQKVHQRIHTRHNDVRLFKTKITTSEEVVWSIFNQQNQTLGGYIALNSLEGRSRSLKDFAELLFTAPDMQEKLNEGFRGRPAIGAVVMSQPNEDHPTWARFWDEIAKVNAADEAKVFIVGSIFGGTGAAGIPTFGAEAVLRGKAALDATGSRSKIYLGSCLVLPYFSFSTNVPQEEAGRLFVTPDDFPLATRTALKYYLEKKLAYDEIYLIGDRGSEEVGQFGAGAASQKNRAHYVEMGGALAALDFFDGDAPPDDRSEPRYFIAARTGEEINWQALPVSRRGDTVANRQNSVRYWMTTTAMSFYSLASYGGDILDGKMEEPSWWKEHFIAGKSEGRFDPRNALQNEVIQRMVEYGAMFLQWLLEITGDSAVRLFDMRAILDEGGRLIPWRSSPVTALVGGASKELFPTAFVPILFDDDLNSADVGSNAADRLINLFAIASGRFAQTKLNVARPQAMG